MEKAKGVVKPQHWMNRYLERLNSEEGMSAEEIYEEENARRAKEGLPLLKFNSIGRTLNTFGYPKSGTKHKRLAEVKPTRIETVIKDIKRKVEKLGELIKEENLSHVEEEFIWLFIEDYPESQIADMLQLDQAELGAIKKKLHLG
ncbi:MAG: hypothetical protein N2V78_03425 [Methanophagales archaeon]|nr:hypothetical protein [Methanophagales archaeon]MCW3141634.1 hypothetical protein [Methanophagales archaeon]